MEYRLLKAYRKVQRMGVGHAPYWKAVEVVDIRKGDVFTLLQPDGVFVEYKGEIVLRATSDAYLDEHNRAFTVDMTSQKEWEVYQYEKRNSN